MVKPSTISDASPRHFFYLEKAEKLLQKNGYVEGWGDWGLPALLNFKIRGAITNGSKYWDMCFKKDNHTYIIEVGDLRLNLRIVDGYGGEGRQPIILHPKEIISFAKHINKLNPKYHLFSFDYAYIDKENPIGCITENTKKENLEFRF